MTFLGERPDSPCLKMRREHLGCVPGDPPVVLIANVRYGVLCYRTIEYGVHGVFVNGVFRRGEAEL